MKVYVSDIGYSSSCWQHNEIYSAQQSFRKYVLSSERHENALFKRGVWWLFAKVSVCEQPHNSHVDGVVAQLSSLPPNIVFKSAAYSSVVLRRLILRHALLA